MSRPRRFKNIAHFEVAPQTRYVERARTHANNSVVALMVPYGRDGSRFRHAGSATLIEHGGQHYAVTAAHVVHEFPNHVYYGGIDRTVFPVALEWIIKQAPPGNRDNDIFDIAVHVIDPVIVQAIGASHFLREEEDEKMVPDERDSVELRQYVSCGFPRKRFWPRYRSNEIEFTTLAVGGSIASVEQHDRVHLHPDTYVVVVHHHKKMQDLSGRHTLPPKLVGMSGGGMFRFHESDGVREGAVPALAGIITTHDPIVRVVYGPRISAVRRFIDDVKIIQPFLPSVIAVIRDAAIARRDGRPFAIVTAEHKLTE